jgi:hypothetical protein
MLKPYFCITICGMSQHGRLRRDHGVPSFFRPLTIGHPRRPVQISDHAAGSHLFHVTVAHSRTKGSMQQVLHLGKPSSLRPHLRRPLDHTVIHQLSQDRSSGSGHTTKDHLDQNTIMTSFTCRICKTFLLRFLDR